MVSANNAIYNTVGASISGVTNTLTVTNASNTASSGARETIVVGGSLAGDPTLNFNVSGITNWEMGIDNSSSDNLTISHGMALGTNDVWKMTTSGQRTLPLQPAFRAYGSGGINVTGDASQYLIGSSSAWTESYDVGSNFNINGTFTAPIAGKYFFYASILADGFTVAHTRGFVFFAVNGSAQTSHGWSNSGSIRDNVNSCGFTGAQMFELSASDTVQLAIRVDNGTKTVNINNGYPENVLWFGYLVF